MTLTEKRKKAEKRFKRYGQIAIAFALICLSFLLLTIIERGWKCFLHTEIKLTLNIQTTEDISNWKHIDTSEFIKNSLHEKFPEAKTRKELLDLVGLLSSGASQTIRNKIISKPEIINKPIEIWLPASDAVDRTIKFGIETNHKISDRQIEWLKQLDKDKSIKLTFNPYFFSTGDSREPELSGFMGSMIGSLFTLISCMIIAFPVGVMAAIYLEEFSQKSKITSWIEVNINNLAAVPSVVYGLLGLSVYLNLFGIPRSSSLAGGLTLALMIMPTIIIATRTSLRAVPESIRDAARGLGASPLQVVLHHSLPLAIPGIMTGTILGIARAMGETAPLLMIGMVAFIADIPRTPIDPATAMPVQIYLWATSPEPSFVEKTSAGIIVLLLVLITMNSLAIFIRKKFEHRW